MLRLKWHRLLLVIISSRHCSCLVCSQSVSWPAWPPPAAAGWQEPRATEPPTAAAAAAARPWPGTLLLLPPATASSTAAAAAAALSHVCYAHSAATCHARVGVCLAIGAAHRCILHGADTSLTCIVRTVAGASLGTVRDRCKLMLGRMLHGKQPQTLAERSWAAGSRHHADHLLSVHFPPWCWAMFSSWCYHMMSDHGGVQLRSAA
jgi:hypothetical protein